jgi:aryl-alcohol dehydrogenase-like predicted oxidoreductase
MRQRRIGDIDVSAIGLGGMPMSVQGRKSHDTSIATIHAALDAGITFIDTADAYTLDEDGHGHNELLIAEALRTYGADTSHVLVATKGGLIHRDEGKWANDGRPEHLMQAAKESAKRLGVDSIGLYQFHQPDPAVPFEESIGALRELYEAGVVRHVGVSNVNVAQIRTAHRLLAHAFVSVQNRFSPAWRHSAPELETCIELDLAFLPWSPLGGISQAVKVGKHNAAFGEIAAQLGVSAQQVALAWELHLSHLVIPIPGASRPQSIRDSALAADLDLTPETMSYLSASS